MIIYILSLLFMFLLICFYGISFFGVTSKEREIGISELTSFGVISMMAIFEVIFFPIMLLGLSFLALYRTFLIISAIIVFIGIRFLRKENVKVKYGLSGINFWKIITVIAVIFIALYISWLHFDVYDDGYYVAIANIAIDENQIILNDNYAYSGNAFFSEYCTRPTINSWELLIACFCKIFHIHPAIFQHTLLPVLLIPLFMMAAFEAFKKFTKNENEIYICLLLYLAMSAFWDAAGIMVSSYMTAGTWIGKAMLWFILFPLIIRNGIDVAEGKDDLSTWMGLSAIGLAGICATATGIYTIPLYYLFIAIPFLLYLITKKSFERLRALCVKMVLCVLPILPIGIYSIYAMQSVIDGWNTNFTFDFRYFIYCLIHTGNIYLVLFAISLVLLGVCEKNKNIKYFILGKDLFSMLIIFNPVIAEMMAKYITGPPVYDRLTYFLSAVIIIPIGVIYIIRLFPKKIEYILVPLLIVLFMRNDPQTMFTTYSTHQNLYMIRNDVLEICYYFDREKPGEDIYLVADQSINKFFRQYSSRYKVTVGRHDEVPRVGLGETYFQMYEEIFDDHLITDETISKLEQFNIEYVLTVEPLEEYEGYTLMMVSSDNTIFVYEKE